MDRKEAIEILKRNKPTSDPRRCGTELCAAVDMAIEALEKQIPKKPELKGEYYICPVCGVYQETSEGNPPYCINCGKRLLWEVEEWQS